MRRAQFDLKKFLWYLLPYTVQNQIFRAGYGQPQPNDQCVGRWVVPGLDYSNKNAI